MDDKSIANMAVLAGEIMLRSGAETYRVEDTIKHILDTAGVSRAGSSSEMPEQTAPLQAAGLRVQARYGRSHLLC